MSSNFAYRVHVYAFCSLYMTRSVKITNLLTYYISFSLVECRDQLQLLIFVLRTAHVR